jgi:hypothetical protein
MKYCLLLLVFAVGILSQRLSAQQRIDPAKMNYLFSPKPNSILYHDTLYKGSAQYMRLFYRTRDDEIIRLYKKHQSNKIWGNIAGAVGTIVTAGGIIIASGNRTADHTAGWITAGSGLACTIFGGYLMMAGQQNMSMAVDLFNNQYNKAAFGIGISGDRAGLVLNF